MLIIPTRSTEEQYRNLSLLFLPLPLEALVSEEQAAIYNLVEKDLAPHHVTCIVGNVVLLGTISLLFRTRHSLFARVESFAYLVPTELEDKDAKAMKRFESQSSGGVPPKSEVE